jgi:diguanylate cyclase (GGDEF)-like protein
LGCRKATNIRISLGIFATMEEAKTSKTVTVKTPPSNSTVYTVSDSTRSARAVMLVVFIAVGLLIAVVMAQRLAFHQSSKVVVEDLRQVLTVSDAMLLEDERLTMSAYMAAASGDRKWVDRYRAHVAALESAIEKTLAMASPQSQQKFASTRSANETLYDLEEKCLEASLAGRLQEATAILNSQQYVDNKAIFGAGVTAIHNEVQVTINERLRVEGNRSLMRTLIAIGIGVIGFALLWFRLDKYLTKTDVAFQIKQQEIALLVQQDALTGLANRRSLEQQLNHAIARVEREGSTFAVMVIDLNGFKAVNDRLGHAAGDELLVEIGRRLQESVRKDEFVARQGGDEFVVLINSATTDGVQVAAARMIRTILQPAQLRGGEVVVGASIGVALCPSDGVDADDLVRKADIALYRAKNGGGNDVRFYQNMMDVEIRAKAQLEADLRLGLDNGQVIPFFQPLIDLASGAITGFEVLARWQHPTRGLIPPLEFIPVAESSGMIDQLTSVVMKSALTSALGWPAHLTIAMNIAPRQLKTRDIIQLISMTLSDIGFPANRFEIEITENALIADYASARDIVLAMKQMGIQVALDDFGTGYSSLSHLAELPFDKIKIDRSFVKSIGQDKNRLIVSAMLGLGKSLLIGSVAEGVETEVDAKQLAELGCTVGQGYWYSRPVPASQVAELIGKFSPQPEVVQLPATMSV